MADDEVQLRLPRRAVRLLARGFDLGVIRESSLTGAEPTPEVSALLALLHDAAHGRRRFAPEPAFATPATVDPGVRKVFTAAEAADLLGCTAKHVRYLCRGGHFPGAYRVAGTGPWLVPAEDLHAFRTERWRQASGQRGYPADSGADRRVATLGADER
jgi:hypothetical protein